MMRTWPVEKAGYRRSADTPSQSAYALTRIRPPAHLPGVAPIRAYPGLYSGTPSACVRGKNKHHPPKNQASPTKKHPPTHKPSITHKKHPPHTNQASPTKNIPPHTNQASPTKNIPHTQTKHHPQKTSPQKQTLPFFGKGVWGEPLSFGTKERVPPTKTLKKTQIYL